jgi:hypothetical protein
MTGDRHNFRDIDYIVSGKVCFDHGSTVEIQGKGSILFQGSTRDQWVLYDVYFIPKLRRNIVSWHGHLGHINFQALKMLVEKEMARGHI